MRTYFKIRYEFDREAVHSAIADRLARPGSDYINVADGVILNTANRDPRYLQVVNGGMFSICDSSYVPLYIKWIYGERLPQYCGSEIFRDIVASRRYRMIFLGTQQATLDGLRDNLASMNPDVASMTFAELPFLPVEEFDYLSIARMIEADGADIVWIALGAPKQEQFMARLRPHLTRGVMIAVGAAFKFYSGVETSRAPRWMVRHHLEFVHRIAKEPRKQLRRCARIIVSLPTLLYSEWRRSKRPTQSPQ
ncbi:MAG: WecB/TagA/CpsF family glycosyltransferase [[Clostridium] fimetarium]|nr:WecB/TagA/CpsF family glycosyltransferase [[Clostridium] fimetarium]